MPNASAFPDLFGPAADADADSPFSRTLFHLAMGGDPDDLPPDWQHNLPHAQMLLAPPAPLGPGLLGDVRQHLAQGQAIDQRSTSPTVEDQSDETDVDRENQTPTEQNGPNVPANSAVRQGPLDTTLPEIRFNPDDGARRTYNWPVPGDGAPAVRGAIGPNGLKYADGSFAPDGSHRSGRPHYGIDLPATVGDPVQAVGDGYVYGKGNASGWGRYIAVRHPDGNMSVYGHLDSTEPLNVGEKVSGGQKIATVGQSGNAAGYGTHLHLEIRKDIGRGALGKISAGAKAVDPTKWINGEVVQ